MEAAVPKREHPRVKRVLLPSFYLAPVEYYAALFHAHSAQVEVHDHYQKQSYRNRCVIAGANGPMTLSIPVEKAKSDTAPHEGYADLGSRQLATPPLERDTIGLQLHPLLPLLRG